MIRPINCGGYSCVWLVLERTVDGPRYFACKKVSKEQLLSGGRAAAVSASREKQALLSAQPHPFIPRLHATGQDEHSLYLLIDLALGGDLRGALLKARQRACGPRLPSGQTQPTSAVAAGVEGSGGRGGKGGLDPKLVRFYVAALMLVLKHLHALGFAYRDLKPENVLVDARGYPLLCDLGTAVHLGASGRAHTVCGTWEYAAPEQLAGRGATMASDWWAFAVLLCECLSGELPFEAADADGGPCSILKAISQHGAVAAATAVLGDPAASELLCCLLEADERRRWHAAQCVQSHDYFGTVDTEALLRRELAPPSMPLVLGAADTRNFSYADLGADSEPRRETLLPKGGEDKERLHDFWKGF